MNAFLTTSERQNPKRGSDGAKQQHARRFIRRATTAATGGQLLYSSAHIAAPYCTGQFQSKQTSES